MNLLQTIKLKIVHTFRDVLNKRKRRKQLKELFRYYESRSVDADQKKALDYLREKNRLTAFPHPFDEKYDYKNIEAHFDGHAKLYYVIHNNKRLYFSKSYTKIGVKKLYASLISESDPESPHRYLSEDFKIEPDDVLVDVGCAEGILSLDAVETAKKICLFEYDDNFIEALKHTFKPWKDKVEIVKKFVSDNDEGNNISLDTYFKNKTDKPSFIKIDVEGAEQKVLNGMSQICKSADNLKAAICTYHKCDDLEVLSSIMSDNGFRVSVASGYMIYLSDFRPPYFRRGLIRATKKTNRN